VIEQRELIVAGQCAAGDVPFAPTVRVEGTNVVVTLLRPEPGITAAAPWGERIALPALGPGTYVVIVRALEEELARRTIVIAQPPFRVVPASMDGEHDVLLIGVPIGTCRAPATCVPLSVTFGNKPASRVTVTPRGEIIATAPYLSTGTLDVTVTNRDGVTLTLPNGFSTRRILDSDYDRVLIPLNFDANGAYGAQWRSEIIVRNGSPVFAETNPAMYVYPNSPTLPIAMALPPFQRAPFPKNDRDGGAFLFVPGGLEEYFSYSSHILDRSRSTSSLGTEMPIVRARDTRDTLELIDVPLAAEYRLKLRIYDFDLENGRNVTVVLRDAETNREVRRVPLTLVATSCFGGPCFAPHPPFAMIDLDGIGELRGLARIDVTIEAQTHEARIWAFISVTNNQTQQVTLYTPQQQASIH
jgi:hypothetical protein